LAAVLAEVSMKIRPCSLANDSPWTKIEIIYNKWLMLAFNDCRVCMETGETTSSLFTSRLASRSLRQEYSIFSITLKNPCVNGDGLPFISNKHNDHIGTGVLSCIFKPGCEMVKCISSRYVIN
jgi:hypothetical protein